MVIIMRVSPLHCMHDYFTSHVLVFSMNGGECTHTVRRKLFDFGHDSLVKATPTFTKPQTP